MKTYPARTRGLNFFVTDERLQAFLRRSAPDLLARQGATLSSLGDFAGNRLDVQAERSDQDFPPALKDVPEMSRGRGVTAAGRRPRGADRPPHRPAPPRSPRRRSGPAGRID